MVFSPDFAQLAFLSNFCELLHQPGIEVDNGNLHHNQNAKPFETETCAVIRRLELQFQPKACLFILVTPQSFIHHGLKIIQNSVDNWNPWSPGNTFICGF